MKIDPYYQRRKSRSITLISGNINLLWVFEVSVRFQRSLHVATCARQVRVT